MYKIIMKIINQCDWIMLQIKGVLRWLRMRAARGVSHEQKMYKYKLPDGDNKISIA